MTPINNTFEPNQWEFLKSTLTHSDDLKKITFSSGQLVIKPYLYFIKKWFKSHASLQEKKVYHITRIVSSYFQVAIQDLQKDSFPYEKLKELKNNLSILNTIQAYINSKRESHTNLSIWYLKKSEELDQLRRTLNLEINKKLIRFKIQEENLEGLREFFINSADFIGYLLVQAHSSQNERVISFCENQLQELPLKKGETIVETLFVDGHLNEVEKLLELQMHQPHFNRLLIKALQIIAKENKKQNFFIKIAKYYQSFLGSDERRELIEKIKHPTLRKFLSQLIAIELDHNDFLTHHCEKIIEWIQNPKVPLISHQKQKFITREEPNQNEIVDALINTVLELSNNNLLRMPHFHEEGCDKPCTQDSSFLIILLEYLYQSPPYSKIEQRSRLVIEKFKKSSPFLGALISHCDHLNKKGKSGQEILEYVKKLIKQGHEQISTTLTSHRVSKTNTPLLAPIVNATPPLKKQENVPSFWKIHTLYYGVNPKTIIFKDMIKNLEDIGLQEGFKAIPFIIEEDWLRDIAFRASAEEFLIPQTTSISLDLYPFLYMESALSSDCLNYTDPNKQLVDGLMGRVYTNTKVNSLFNIKDNPNALKVKRSQFYFEGGNLLKAKNKEGKEYVICGAMNLLTSFFISRKRKTFEQKTLRAKLEGKIAALEIQGIYTDNLIKKTAETLFKTFPNLCVDNLSITNKISLAKQAIAEIEVIKDTLNEELGSSIIFLTSGYGFDQKQLGLHLDMTMLPAPNGVIFLEDHEKSIQVLNILLSSDRLTVPQTIRLREFLKNALLLHKRDRAHLKEITEELKSYNFEVISTPSRYVSSDNSINYMNGIPGHGATGNFVITSGFKGIPGESYLRDAMTLTLQAGGIDSVYFTGKSSTLYLDSAPIDTLSHVNLKACGSIHCRTLD